MIANRTRKSTREMRPTLHDYVIDLNATWETTENYMSFRDKVTNFAKLTNRAPRLGDFVPCDEDGNVLEKPKGFEQNEHQSESEMSEIGDLVIEYQAAQDRVIFKGDWEVIRNGEVITEIKAVINEKEIAFAIEKKLVGGKVYLIGGDTINRIEDLPREIEFKEGLI